MSNQSILRPVSSLRRRMLEDMAMRGLREETQRDYLRVVSGFAAFLGRAPDTATDEDIRRFQVHQTESGVQPPTINCSVSVCGSDFHSRIKTAIDRCEGDRIVLGPVILKEKIGITEDAGRVHFERAAPARS